MSASIVEVCLDWKYGKKLSICKTLFGLASLWRIGNFDEFRRNGFQKMCRLSNRSLLSKNRRRLYTTYCSIFNDLCVTLKANRTIN